MEDFANIKEGDFVFIERCVNYGWRSGKSFSIHSEVTRTTKTQFLVGDRRFKKDGGYEVGEYFNKATKEGKDQTLEMNAFKVKKDLYFKLKRTVRDFNIGDIDDSSKSDMKDLLTSAKKRCS